MELTTYHGHANALGIRRWHDFRRRTPSEMAALRAEVQAEGALFVVNHPKMTGPPWELGDEALADAVEGVAAALARVQLSVTGRLGSAAQTGASLTAVGAPTSTRRRRRLARLPRGRPALHLGLRRRAVGAALLAGLRAGHALSLPARPALAWS